MNVKRIVDNARTSKKSVKKAKTKFLVQYTSIGLINETIA